MCSYTVKLNACTHKSLSCNQNKHRCTHIKTSMIKKFKFHSDCSVSEKKLHQHFAIETAQYITNAENMPKKHFCCIHIYIHLVNPQTHTHTHTHRQNINTHTLPHHQSHLHMLTPTQIGCHRQTLKWLINKTKKRSREAISPDISDDCRNNL